MCNDRLLKVGLGGTVIAALCCVTPFLPFLLGAVGLSAATGYLDVVLLPAIGVFLAITAYAVWRRLT